MHKLQEIQNNTVACPNMALCSTFVVPVKLRTIRTKDRPPKTQPPPQILSRPVPSRPGAQSYIFHIKQRKTTHTSPQYVYSHHVRDYLISTLAIQQISLATFYRKHYLYQNYFRSHKNPHIHLTINTTSKHVKVNPGWLSR